MVIAIVLTVVQSALPIIYLGSLTVNSMNSIFKSFLHFFSQILFHSYLLIIIPFLLRLFSGVRLGVRTLKEEEGTSRHKASSPKMVTFLVTKKIYFKLGLFLHSVIPYSIRNYLNPLTGDIERETGVGPATSTLARSRSTTELFPQLPLPP